MNKIIYYYQTFIGLQPLLTQDKIFTTHIIVSSIHFGRDKKEQLYIHLNDYHPDDKQFLSVWKDCAEANEKGITIMTMIGGAGGAYSTFFESLETYNVCYSKLKELKETYPFIKGFDLDIEETVNFSYVTKLINDLFTDFGKDFIITMAPVAGALVYDYPGMGGFCYKNLLKTPQGKMIHWFNGQFYFQFTEEYFECCVENGYNPNQIVFGMISSDFINNFENALEEIKKVKNEYPTFGGVYIWEYCNSPPDNKRPYLWSEKIGQILS